MNDLNRQDKINFLKGLSTGTRSADELLPSIRVGWYQDKDDHDLFHCKELGLSVKGNELPDTHEGKRLERIVFRLYGPCDILPPSEYYLTLDLNK